MTVVRYLVVALLTAAALTGSALARSPAHTASLKQRFFLSPSGNISCELESNPGSSGGLPTQAYCQTITPAQSVEMKPSGSLKKCRGERCLGNPPENASTLGYGHTIKLGPFACKSLTTGMRCTTSTGAGFVISKSGIQRVSV